MKPHDLSPAQSALLRRYESLLLDRALPLGFVAPGDRDVLWPRHIEDSLRAAAAFGRDDEIAYDLGSGAGLPGIPLAIALPPVRFLLVESQRRRVAFLELAVERLGLPNVEIVPERVEEVARRVDSGALPAADVATARAFAPVDAAWRAARDLLRPGGRLVYFAGERIGDPLEAGRRAGGGEAEVTLLEVLASSAPLVIMART